MFVVYVVSRPFGAAAQAGFGIGLRLVQAIFLPVVALGFSVAPVAGQNVGARRFDRVRQTLRTALGLSVGADGRSSAWSASSPPRRWSASSRPDPAVIAVGADYLRIVAWGFAGVGHRVRHARACSRRSAGRCRRC